MTFASHACACFYYRVMLSTHRSSGEVSSRAKSSAKSDSGILFSGCSHDHQRFDLKKNVLQRLAIDLFLNSKPNSTWSLGILGCKVFVSENTAAQLYAAALLENSLLHKKRFPAQPACCRDRGHVAEMAGSQTRHPHSGASGGPAASASRPALAASSSRARRRHRPLTHRPCR